MADSGKVIPLHARVAAAVLHKAAPLAIMVRPFATTVDIFVSFGCIAIGFGLVTLCFGVDVINVGRVVGFSHSLILEDHELQCSGELLSL